MIGRHRSLLYAHSHSHHETKKPVGALSEDKGDDCVPALLRHAIGKPVYSVHRLDRAVGGVMVCSTSEVWTGRLTQSMQSGGEKTYFAVVAGDPGETGVLRDLLYHDPKTNKTFVVQRERRGVRKAELAFERVETVRWEQQTLSLVRVTLHTGRTHQIRVQFASRGMPLVGDRRYGSRIPADVALWSYALSLNHPKAKQRMTFCHTPPSVFPFSLFATEC